MRVILCPSHAAPSIHAASSHAAARKPPRRSGRAPRCQAPRKDPQMFRSSSARRTCRGGCAAQPPRKRRPAAPQGSGDRLDRTSGQLLERDQEQHSCGLLPPREAQRVGCRVSLRLVELQPAVGLAERLAAGFVGPDPAPQWRVGTESPSCIGSRCSTARASAYGGGTQQQCHAAHGTQGGSPPEIRAPIECRRRDRPAELSECCIKRRNPEAVPREAAARSAVAGRSMVMGGSHRKCRIAAPSRHSRRRGEQECLASPASR